jgi:succinate-semialdehyde dehydrogenase/glutarate-semialdehyde dehydrogenase
MNEVLVRLADARLLMAGEWRDGVSHNDVLDKFHLAPCGRLHIASRDQVRKAVAAARTAYVESTLTAYVDLMPYGGSKDSAFGREGPRYAIHEMSELRTVTFSA